MDVALTETVKAKFVALDPLFDERLRRRWAAVEARGIGRGGIARVAAATGKRDHLTAHDRTLAQALDFAGFRLSAE